MVVIEIFKYCHIINEFNKNIKLIHVPGHDGINGNEIADWLAKYGVYKAKEHDAIIERNRNENRNNNKKLDKKYIEERKEYEKQEKLKRERKNERSINSTLMKNMKKTKHMMKEMLQLSRCESAVLARLRTEHIELNKYKNIVKTSKLHSNTVNCEKCNSVETVKHYLINCKRFKKQREEMWIAIEMIDEFFKNKYNRTINNLLFYYKKQEKPHLKNKIDIRVNIIKEILKFVVNTQRFEKIVIDDNNKLIHEYDSIIYKGLKKKYRKKGFRVDVIDLISDSESESDNNEE